MIISIVIGVVAVIFLMRVFGPFYGLGERILFLLLSLALGCVAFVLSISCAGVIGNNIPKVYTLQSSSQITALKDNQNLYGHSFLGTGSVNSEMRYYYAVDTAQGYTVRDVKVSDSYLLFDDDNPRIESYQARKFKNKLHYIYAYPYGHFYKIYIPNGSLSSEYEVDLE